MTYARFTLEEVKWRLKREEKMKEAAQKLERERDIKARLIDMRVT